MEWVNWGLLSIFLLGGIGTVWWARRREQYLQTTSQKVRCPVHDTQAALSVRTDSRAWRHRQHVDVVACSLLSESAVALPERTGYLPEFPSYKVCLDAEKPYPSYAMEASCRKHCLFLLNRAAEAGLPRPVSCASGASDGIELVRQTFRDPAVNRLLWYNTL